MCDLFSGQLSTCDAMTITVKKKVNELKTQGFKIRLRYVMYTDI